MDMTALPSGKENKSPIIVFITNELDNLSKLAKGEKIGTFIEPFLINKIMNEEIDFIFDLIKEKMTSSISHLELEFTKIRAGRSNPSMLDGIMVDYYGTKTVISQVGNIATPDPRTITVQPWEKDIINEIKNAINSSNIGLNAQDNGEMIIINIPALTEERRIQLVKQVKAETENARVAIRNSRKDGNDELKKFINQVLFQMIY